MRKAMGADAVDVIRLLLWQFTRPVLWANLIAWPAAFWVMNFWLHGFAYRVDLPRLAVPGRDRGGGADRLGHRLVPVVDGGAGQAGAGSALRIGEGQCPPHPRPTKPVGALRYE